MIIKIDIEPCIVTSISIANQIEDIFYEIAHEIGSSPGVLSGAYLFGHTPDDCFYDIAYTVTGVMPFFSYREESKDFYLPETSDATLAGRYQVSVTAQIDSFKDKKKNSFLTTTKQMDFWINLKPC